jgi:hypothetical protein
MRDMRYAIEDRRQDRDRDARATQRPAAPGHLPLATCCEHHIYARWLLRGASCVVLLDRADRLLMQPSRKAEPGGGGTAAIAPAKSQKGQRRLVLLAS